MQSDCSSIRDQASFDKNGKVLNKHVATVIIEEALILELVETKNVSAAIQKPKFKKLIQILIRCNFFNFRKYF